VRASKANWRTIAVGALTLGGGYYALDVTEPTKPVFLWQLTTAASSTGPRRLFGPTPGTPAIGVVYYQEPGSTEPIETPVAFLPGGGDTPWGAATRTCTRWPQSPTLSGVRTSTHCWTGSALSFTVVRLLDGKIIRTFRNNPAGDGAMTSAATNHPDETATSPVGAALSTVVVGAYAKIDAPISGTVATYPAATGTVTTRAFVGDLDGTLWKADVSAPDPASWTFGIFHDAYAHEVVTPALVGQPISAAPVVSVDRVGDVMVVYGTGNQNKFDPSFVNHVWSVTERVSGSGSTTAFTPTANWHMRFDTGLTPTGPLTLFNEMTYFSTYSPDSASAGQCLSGSGTLWSVHYLDSDGTPTTDEDGSVKNLPKAGFVLGSGEAINTAGAGYFIPRDCRVGGTLASKVTIANQPSSVGNFRCMELDQGSIVFGAGVTSRPSCADPAASSLGTDPITGATTSHTQPSAITPGSFELVVQTGPRAGTGAGGSSTKTLPRTLVAPVSQTRIDSWAAIVE
jgi:type IV pilus assembly protein PilY1